MENKTKVSANILVIDDEMQIRKLLEITLQSNGFKVSQAATAKEGLIAAANYSPSMVINNGVFVID